MIYLFLFSKNKVRQKLDVNAYTIFNYFKVFKGGPICVWYGCDPVCTILTDSAPRMQICAVDIFSEGDFTCTHAHTP